MEKQKIIISAILSGVISVMSTMSFASFDTEFKSSEASFIYSGTEKSEYVKVIVSPKNILPENITESDVNSAAVIIKTETTDENSEYSGKIVLPDGFSYGCYITQAIGDEEKETRLFVYSDSAALDAAESAIKSGADAFSTISENIALLGFDSEVFAKYGSKISDICKSYVKDGLSLTDAYMIAEGVSLTLENEMSLSQMLGLYADFMSFEADEFLAESDEMKKEWENVFKAQIFSDESFEKTMEKAKILALFNIKGRDASDEVIALFIEEDVDLEDFNELSEYYQGKVFSAIAENTYLDLDELIEDFLEETSNQLEEENDKGSSSGGGGGGGGSSSSKAGNLAFAADADAAESDKFSFLDTVNHWGEAEIKEMAAKGIINGFDDGNFCPDQKITRAEFTKLIAGLLKLPEMSGNVFSDVDSEQWFAPFVYSAKENGLINGVSENLFAPHKNITREDAAVILKRVLEKSNVKYEGKAAFSDENEIADYAKDAVLSLAYGEIIRGADGKFNPKNNLTRAEAAALLCRISKIIK